MCSIRRILEEDKHKYVLQNIFMLVLMCWGGGVGWGREICYTAVMIAPLDKRRLDRCSLFWWDSWKKGLLCPPRLTAPPWRPKKFSLWKIFNLYLYCNLPVCIPFKNLKKLEANRCLEERQMCILFTGKDCSTVYIQYILSSRVSPWNVPNVESTWIYSKCTNTAYV